jgi:hypothetical protein
MQTEDENAKLTPGQFETLTRVYTDGSVVDT